jgi:hypothetical protein
MGEKTGKSTLAAEDNIKTNVMEICHDNVNTVRLTQEIIQRRQL